MSGSRGFVPVPASHRSSGAPTFADTLPKPALLRCFVKDDRPCLTEKTPLGLYLNPLAFAGEFLAEEREDARSPNPIAPRPTNFLSLTLVSSVPQLPLEFSAFDKHPARRTGRVNPRRRPERRLSLSGLTPQGTSQDAISHRGAPPLASPNRSECLPRHHIGRPWPPGRPRPKAQKDPGTALPPRGFSMPWYRMAPLLDRQIIRRTFSVNLLRGHIPLPGYTLVCSYAASRFSQSARSQRPPSV